MIRFTLLYIAFCMPSFLVLADDTNVQISGEMEELRTLRKEVEELRGLVDKLTEKQGVNKEEIVGNKSKIVENKAEISAAKPKPHSDFDVPSLNIRGFGHLQYDYVNESPRNQPDRDTNHFTDGDIGFLFTSQISKKLTFFNETLFKFTSDGDTNVNVERVMLNYEFADWLNISIGRDHTPLGYWNQNYHHATWTHTTTDRPLIFQFEGNDGVLPMHYVGIGLSGNVGLDFGNVEYSFTIGNGRGEDTESIQIINDRNDDKQVSFQFTVEPEVLDGFGFGANVLYDVIPNNPNIIGRENEIDEVIAGGHMYYTGDPYEIIAEYQYIWHDDLRSTKSHHGGYLQLGYKFGEFKPYYRFDILDIASNDAYFAGLRGAENSIEHTVGVRYELFPFAALKLEYRRLDADYMDSNEISSQISFMY
ncbi:MAG: porin [Methylococcales bacterium]|nr:porin [Methylococcales bacterium]